MGNDTAPRTRDAAALLTLVKQSIAMLGCETVQDVHDLLDEMIAGANQGASQ